MFLKYRWIDRGFEATSPPNPDFPEGVDLDTSRGANRSCRIELPYPAKRCGMYVVDCQTCRAQVAITTAGRADDPKSVKLACRRKGMN